MASKERSFTVSESTISYGSMISSYAYQYDECNGVKGTVLLTTFGGHRVKGTVLVTHDLVVCVPVR